MLELEADGRDAVAPQPRRGRRRAYTTSLCHLQATSLANSTSSLESVMFDSTYRRARRACGIGPVRRVDSLVITRTASRR